MNKLFEAALAYKKAGLDVIPDHPTLKYPVGFPGWEKKNFTEEELRDCILNKRWGIGLRNQEGLDFDNHGSLGAKEIIESWEKLVNVICPGLVDRLLIETTQHEGYHVAWKCEEIEGNQKLASRLPTKEELQKDPKLRSITFIETRGLGGQFVVSPTLGYKLIQGDWCNLSQITPEERNVLLQCARSLDLIPIATEDFKSSGNNFDGERPGDLFNKNGIDEALEILKQNGWTIVFEQKNTNTIFLRRPGKEKGISATFGHIAPGIFYNFTSNGSPFEPNKAYTPFAVFSLLKHKGNFSLAASELAKRYGLNEKVTSVPIQIPTGPEFLKQEFGDIDWIVDELIPSSGSAIIVAKRESFKTWLALYFASCITRGISLWDKIPTHRSRVLYVTNDDPSRNFQKRVNLFNFDDSLFIYHSNLPSFSIELQNGSFESVKNKISEEKIELVIVDILRNTHNKDSNTDKDAKLVFDKYKELRESNPNLAFIFLIHPSKEQALERKFGRRQAEEAVGSYYWEAAVDTVISLTKTTEEDTDQVVISVTKNKQSEKKIKPFIGIRRQGEGEIQFLYEEKIPDKLKIEEAKEYILQILGEKDYKRSEIIELVVASGICSIRLVESALKELTNEGEVIHTKSKPHIYSLAKNESTNDSANRNGIYELRNAESKVKQTELLPKDANEQ
ncbi:AAA family ATPase [Candidatus Woesebacteria bacterium]|nr:AAA family ATPase [Candidatus Woesebacteria bacterium]QQG47315.1 MAG: AAA family ATPase [Candidatus Woesebacteria bacterium]